MNNTIHHTKGKQVTEDKSNITTEEKPFNPLTPVSDADEKGHYREMLQWALRNTTDNDIRNIALTGPYGSGKSSILKTFEKNNSNKKLVFLNISLATFKDESIEEEKLPQENSVAPSKKGKTVIVSQENFSKKKFTLLDKEKQLRLIEYSILQQIFYHENESTIPDSRFKRIRSFSEHDAYFLTLGIFTFAVALLYELFSKHLWGMVRFHPVKSMDITFHIFALLAMLYLGYKFIERTIRPLRSLQFKKFTIQKAEFAVADDINKSILNEHLDEILYFFEVTDYSVVVFEDLDRFDQPDIFTKLRELNQLINYSKKIERKVAFIYAVRDDMFLDKNRTKFFDFIIPVIPVIHSENSKEKLRDLNKKNSYGIKESLLDDISLYVSDMRMVYNIMNEYYLYHKMLEVKSQEKLLAMILYKNIYPKDFVSLCSREGVLFKVINNKDEYIKKRLEALDEEIQSLQNQLHEIENAEPQSENELRQLYIFECLNSHPNAKKFVVDDKDYDFKDITNETLFQALINNTLQFKYSAATKDEAMQVAISFEDIETRVDKQFKYEQRLALIRNKLNGRIEAIKEEIDLTNERKASAARSSLKTLIKNNFVETAIKDEKQNQLIRTLLGDGHIDEFYMDYVSLFYPGSLTHADANFLRSVRAHIHTDFDHPINSIDNLIKKLSDIDFEGEYILNFSLVNHVLETPRYEALREKIFNTLSNEGELSFKFITAYLQAPNDLELFVGELTERWHNIWNFLNKRYHAIEDGFLNGPKIDLDEYLKLIIQSATIEDIKKIAAGSTMAEYIAGQENFFRKFGPTGRLKAIVKSLDVKFKYLAIEDLPNDIVEMVYIGRHYEINQKMVFEWFYVKDGFNDGSFSHSNYSRIMDNEDFLPLKNYIDDNLATYISSVWLNISEVYLEGTLVIEYFLSSENLSLELKEAIIMKNSNSVHDTSKIKDVEVLRILLRENKLFPKWDNLLRYYELNDKNFDNYLTDFLNAEPNVRELEKEELSSRTVKPQLLVNDFGTALILTEEIENRHYYFLLQTMTWSYSGGLKFEKLSPGKVSMLINEKKLDVSKENHEKLKFYQPTMVAQLLEKDPVKLMRDINEFKFTSEDITIIMGSTRFDADQKSRVLTETTEFFITNSNTALEAVAEASYNNGQLILSTNILLAILKCEGVSVEQKISLLHRIILQLSTYDIHEILRRWGKPYDKIRPGSEPVVLIRNEYHIRLAELLTVSHTIVDYKTAGRKITLENYVI